VEKQGSKIWTHIRRPSAPAPKTWNLSTGPRTKECGGRGAARAGPGSGQVSKAGGGTWYRKMRRQPAGQGDALQGLLRFSSSIHPKKWV